MEDDIQVSDWTRRRPGAAVHAGELARGGAGAILDPMCAARRAQKRGCGGPNTTFCHLLVRDPAVTHGAPSPPLTRGINPTCQR